MRILHLSSEYPDELRPRTILAIRRLVACSNQFAHNHVISLHRRAMAPTLRLRRYGDHTILCERGSVLPFRHRAFVENCTQKILAERLAQDFDLVHAHKLTIEGCIARGLKLACDVDYCVSVRATDFVLIRHNPHRRAEFLRVLDDATRIAVIAPWMVERLSAAFGARWTAAHERKLVVLGNVVDGALLKRETHNHRYVLPIRLIRSQLSRKNVLRTLRAVRSLRSDGHDIRLDVIGDGSGKPLLQRWLRRLGLSEYVTLLGEIPNSQIIDRLADYKAVALFSYPETFGLVYLEALHAGIPLLHARHTGVDGLFPGFRIGVSAAHDSESKIRAAVLEMEAQHAVYRDEVYRLQDSGALSAFGSDSFARRLAQELYAAPAAPHPSSQAAHPVPEPRRQFS